MKLVVVALVFLTGCSTSTKRGEPFKAAPSRSDRALLYIYRAQGDWGTARTPTIVIDRNQKYDSLHNGYRFFYLNEGEHVVEVDGGSPKVRFKAENGKTYYLRYDMRGNQSYAGMSFGLIGALIAEAVTPEGPGDEVKSKLAEGIALDGFNQHMYFVRPEPALKELATTSLVVDKAVTAKKPTPEATTKAKR
jgi:hypothetical protein